MGVQAPDLRRQRVGQHQRLAKPADAVAGALTGKVGEPQPPRGAVARAPANRAPGAQEAERCPVQIFRQIVHGRPDLVVHRMARAIGRVAQGVDDDIEPARFQALDLLRDKGLGQARIALEDEGDGIGRHGGTGGS